MTSSGLRLGYRRSGGFAGIELTAEVAADELPAEQAATAADLLDDPALGRPTGSTPPGAADLFSYRLRLADDGRQHTFEWTDLTLPDAVRPLVSTLNRLARPS